MFALSVGTNELAVVSDLSLSEFCDLPPGEIATLLDSKNGKPRELYVRIMLLDWASVFELEALTMDEDASISPPPKATFSKMLYIGDSISCAAYAQLEDDYNKPSRGCLDAFPYVAQRVLAQGQPSKVGSIDLISYPGWALVAPDEQEKGWGNPLGMEDKFFHVRQLVTTTTFTNQVLGMQVSPWNTDLYAQPQPEAEVIVIELGS
ncbi:hypothetical protein FRC07_005546 [Ceratobasidium sp. 392]|nr:hypothetical protein FRC07_005546 [Ceratobasidium sp. 392]